MKRARDSWWGRLICLIGAGTLLVSLAADWLTGSRPIHVGSTQMLGCLGGLGTFAFGLVLWKVPRFSSVMNLRWAISVYLVGSSLLLSAFWPTDHSTLVLLGYAASICLVLPIPFGILTFVGFAGATALLEWINKVKEGLTGMPVTVLDIKIAVANPAGLSDALGLPHWTLYGVVALLSLVALGWCIAGLMAIRRLSMQLDHNRFVNWVSRVAIIVTSCALVYVHFGALAAKAAADDSTWLPERVSRWAGRMGVIPFLAYSYGLESRVSGDIYQSDPAAIPPNAEEIRRAIVEHIDFSDLPPSQSRLSPNILVVLAESTFDPGATFRLTGDWSEQLFLRDHLTAASGLLRVNVVGGGTWITEFETIVGLDSQWFGYSGMYTHASLSPFINRSIASYLREHGYGTWAFFPNLGNFYNARNAYKHYGFEHVLDSHDLGQGTWVEDDRRIAQNVRDVLGRDPDMPFFGYILFLENHAPHDCNIDDPRDFSARFADTDDFEPNCALHEYLRRLESTTAAVQSLVQYLEVLQDRTGRPFVLLVFGDHQPHTFTNTTGIHYDYTALRQLPDEHLTFFHIFSSVPGRSLRCCGAVPPASLLPTLVSGFVAKSPNDVYLGVNLWLYDHCGSNTVDWDFGGSLGEVTGRSGPRRSADCSLAYQSALAWYRASGVVRLGGG